MQQVEKVKKKGKSASIFNLKEKVLGGKKQNQEATSIIDPKTKKRLFDHEEIKKASLQYVCDLLTNEKPKEDFKSS